MTIGIWGDSIVYGSCDSEALGWAGRLRKALPTDDYNNLYNFGICGETSEDLLKRFDIEAEAIGPEHIVFAVGINDSKFPDSSDENKVSLEDYEKNLNKLIASAKTHTSSIAVVSATKVNDEWRSVRGSRFMNEEIEKFNAVMVKVAQEHKIKFIDVFDTVDPTTDLDDGLHPNAQGYEKMYKIIKDNLDWV
jgi:acyl-CoA thioesterase-1